MTALYVDKRGVELQADQSSLVFLHDGHKAGSFPLDLLSRMFIRGDARLNASLLGKLGKHGIGVVVLSGRKAEPTLLLPSLHRDVQRRERQHLLFRDPLFRFRMTQNLLREKLGGQRERLASLLATRPAFRHSLTASIRQLQSMETLGISSALTVDSLRGVEGAAGACYFGTLAEVLPSNLDFHGRNRRPPRDPFNVLLSLLYTVLQAELEISIHGVGLDPFLGFFHVPEHGRPSLACDLAEVFRAGMDGLAVRLFAEEILRPEDFTMDNGACLMGKAGRMRLYPELERFMRPLRRRFHERGYAVLRELGLSGEDLHCREGEFVRLSEIEDDELGNRL